MKDNIFQTYFRIDRSNVDFRKQTGVFIAAPVPLAADQCRLSK